MSTRKSIQKLNTTESPTKPTLPMSAAALSPQTQSSKLPLLELDTKVSDTTTSTVASDDDVTTTTTTSTPTESSTTTTTVKSSPKTATTENDLIKTSDSEIMDTTITTATTSSLSITKGEQLSPTTTTNTDLTITTTLDTIKRGVGRRKNSAASSITSSSSPTCSQQSIKKTSGHNSSSIGSSNDDINNEELLGDINNENITTNELDDKKLTIIQNSNSGCGSGGEQKLIEDTNKSESPARVGRKKKVFNKSAIITRKSAATTPTTTKKKEESPVVAKPPINIRTSMRNRRNSTGKIVDTKQNEPKKGVKQTRKTLSSTPEPQQRTPIKRKREDSIKSDHDKDDQQPIDKIIKIEKNDDIEQQQQDEEQMDINENDDLNKLDDIEINNDNDISTTNIKNEILVDDKNSVISGGDQIEIDESIIATPTKLDDSSTLLDIKTTDNNELNNSNNKDYPIFYTKARRGRPKNSNQKIIDKTNLRPRRSDKIVTTLELPETKRPKRRGRRCIDEITTPTTAITLEKDHSNNSSILDSSSVLDETINKTDIDLDKSNVELLTKNDNNDDNGPANLNGLEKPLTVDTTTILSPPPLTINDDIKKTATATTTKLNIIDTIIKNELVLASTSSDKSASLSPELISEGVNVISVKQFYKKPQFLENNLGIEKDPKLGEIVQEEVVKNSTTTTTTTTLNETQKNIVEKIEKSTIVDNDVKNTVTDDIKDLISDDSNSNKNDNESNSDSLIEGALHLDDEESTEDDESNKNILIKKTNEINNDEDNDDNDIDDLNTNENIIKNQQKKILIKTKDSNNKENNSSDIIKLNNLCDIKNENHNENSTAVQIVESSTNHNNKSNINIVDDDNIKDKIQSENNNNKKTTNEKDLIKNNDKNEDKKKIIKINKNIKGEEGIGEKEANIDDQLMKSIEITKHIDVTGVNNMKEVLNEKSKKSITKSIETKTENDLMEIDHNVNLEVNEEMEVVNENEKTCKEIVSNKTDEDMKIIEENIVEKIKEKSDKLNSKSIESKIKETDLISNQSSKQENIDECKNINTEQTKKILSNTATTNKRLLETPETMRQKEKHLKNLGLLTHKAAVQAKIEKQRRKKLFQTTAANKKQQQIAESSSSSSVNVNSAVVAGSSSSSNNNNVNLNKTQDSASTSNTSTIYSIKSGENKRKSSGGNGGNSNNNNNNGRQSLKITFQKGRGRGIQNERSGSQSNQSGEEIYYTIQNENEGGQTQEAVVTHGRKSLNRNHTIDTTTTTGSSTNQSDSTIDLQNNNKKDGKQKILIPEKASSFSIHPGRLCQDQCYYCGGKFGLYDTPCHVAQLKSTERQQKILANEEKLTIDNCLCDACFRHVDKRANVPSYKKRLSAAINSIENDNNSGNNTNSQQQQPNNDTDNNNSDEHQMETDQQYQSSFGNRSFCFVPGCNNSAAHSLRKKCIRKTIKKILPNFDMSTIGGITPICSQHYDSILQYLGCALCKRRLGKNHMYHIQESEKLEVLLSENNVPVQIGNSSAICKLCRYFTNLLMKPSTGTKQNDFVRSYRRRLLQFHNVQTDDEASDDADDDNSEKLKSKRNRKLKRSETTILDEKNSESTNSPSSLIIDENPPSSDSSNPTTIVGGAATSGQIMLDNDVLVDYDVPIISSDSPTPSPPPLLSSKLKSILQSSKNNITINNNNDKNNDITTLINNNNKEDISLVLRSNPNISMRELFPGEEEMGLHVNLPFGSSSSHRTPEGWTRVQTFLQYDEPTRRLWEDLQKPYGNQSSFLRHLILLEKYYRNGDLMLTNNASSNASVYSETVQNRLRSYDNNNLININNNNNNNNHIASTSTITVTPINIGGGNVIQQQSGNHRKNSLNNKNEKTSNRNKSDDNLKQFNNNNNNYPITITTRPKQQQNIQSSTSTNNNNNSNNIKNPSNSTSTSNNNNNNNLSNLIVSGNKNAIEILPILSTASLTKTNDLTITTSAGNLMTKQQKLLAAANKLIGNETAIDLKTIPSTSITATSTITNKNDHNQKKNNDINNITNLSMPPELISINRQSLSAGIIMGKQQQQIQQQQRDQHQQQLQLQQQHQRIQNFEQQQQLHNKHNSSSTSKHGIIVLPETLSPMEQINMKNWRPTLMPITSGTHLNQSGPLYKTVDGRKLPAVVQVQSRGRPYLISIYDYNRMCILRREKLLYDQMVKNGKIKHGMRPLTALSPKYLSSHQQQQQQQNKLKIPNKILEQNSLIPVGSGSSSSSGSSGQRSNTTTTTNSLQQQIMSQQQQQLKLRQQQQQQQISLLKSSTSGGNFVPILPKLQNHQLQILPTSNHTPMSLAASLVNNSVSIVPTITGVLSLAQGGTTNIHNTATLTSLTPSTIAGLNSTGVSMRNIMAQQKQRLDQLLLSQSYQKGNIMNSNNRNNNSGGGNGSNLIGGTSTSSSSVLLDNSLLSKIPKSLTVIPQQRLQSQPSQQQQQQGRTSAEDLTSA